MRIPPIFLFLGLFFLLVQCKSKNAPAQGKTIAAVDSARIDSLKNVAFIALSPNEILSDIFSDKKSLNTGIINPTSNAEKYINEKHQAMNLGVYIADFAYLNLTENHSNSLEYFKVIRDLAQKSSIYGCFDESIFDRIQDNLANNDSLISISQEIYYNMTDILENTNRPKVYALISSGALIESLYLTVMNVPENADFEQLARKSFEQERIVQSLSSFIAPFENDRDIKPVYEQLLVLKKIMDEAQRKITKQQITKNKNNHLEVKGGEDLIVSKKSFGEFKNKIILIRNEIVSGSNK